MIKTPKFTIVDFKKIDNVFEFETEPIDVSDVVSISIDFMFSFAIAPTENVEVEIFGSQDGVNFGENNLSKFQILTYSLNTRFIRSFSFNAINYIKLKVKVPHVADIKLTGVKEKDISPNLEIQNNLLADRNPSPTDDITEGYVKGSIWINNLTGQGFICYDNTNENAVWHTMDSPEHEISGSLIRFRNPDGSWGNWISTLDVYWGDILGNISNQTDLINNFSLSVPEGAIAYFTNSLIDNINGIKPEGYDITTGINRIEAINYGNTGSYNKIQIDGIDALTGSEIVEEGSNANGNYIKYENGILVVWCQQQLDYYSSFVLRKTLSFPIVFSEIPVVQVSPGNPFNIDFTVESYTFRVDYISTTQSRLDYVSPSNLFASGDYITYQILVIGRWK